MTYADSICRQIEQRAAELRSLCDALDKMGAVEASGAWDPREILLHLIGATNEIPDDLARAPDPSGDLVAPRQPGGEYFDRPEIATASDAASILLRQLDRIAAAVRGLDDDALRRRVTVMDGDGNPMPDVPVGLVVRHSVTDHFGEHLAQLRQAIAATPPAPSV